MEIGKTYYMVNKDSFNNEQYQHITEVVCGMGYVEYRDSWNDYRKDWLKGVKSLRYFTPKNGEWNKGSFRHPLSGKEYDLWSGAFRTFSYNHLYAFSDLGYVYFDTFEGAVNCVIDRMENGLSKQNIIKENKNILNQLNFQKLSSESFDF